jgi:hypothetical protein
MLRPWFATTPAPDVSPWRMLVPSLKDLKAREYVLGWTFPMSGTLTGDAQTAAVSYCSALLTLWRLAHLSDILRHMGYL